jgi:hypothetical protein
MGMSRLHHIVLALLGTALLLIYNSCSSELNEKSVPSVLSSTCVPAPGVSGSPQNIEQVVNLINSLPRPVTVECFLKSLDRPLDVNLTSSQSSAQPSGGADSPRIFIFKGNLIMSIVPVGPGAKLLELSLIKGFGRTLKAEIEFPIFNGLSQATPFNRIHSGGLTTCMGCHRNEVRDGSITYANAFVSDAIRPNYFFAVTVNELKLKQSVCNEGTEPDRCAILNALFSGGEVRDREFPSSIP